MVTSLNLDLFTGLVIDHTPQALMLPYEPGGFFMPFLRQGDGLSSPILPVPKGFFRFWLQVPAFWCVYGQATKILFFLYGKIKTVSLGISNSVGNVQSMTTHDHIKPTTGNT